MHLHHHRASLRLAEARIQTSVDDGVTWSAASTGLPATVFLDGITRDATTGNFFVSNGEKFFVSANGTDWSALAATGLPQAGGFGLSARDGELYAFDQAEDGISGVQLSLDSGSTFSALNSGLPETELTTVLLPPSDTVTALAGTHHQGVFRSTSHSAWQPSQNGLNAVEVESVAVDPNNPQIVYAGSFAQGVFKSSDGGSSWTPHKSGLPGSDDGEVSLLVDPSSSSRLFAGTEDFHGVFRSVDGGVTWVAVNTGMSQVETINALVGTTTAIFAATTGGLFFSTSQGDAWTSITANLGAGTTTPSSVVTGVVVDPGNSNVLWASVQQNGVWKSSNLGASWTQTALTTNVSQLALSGSGATARLYAATGAPNLMRSDDAGATWTTLTDTLTGTIDTVAVEPQNGARVYAAGTTGAFFSADAGAHFTRIDSSAQPLRAKQIAVDSATPPTAWLGASSFGGVFKTP